MFRTPVVLLCGVLGLVFSAVVLPEAQQRPTFRSSQTVVPVFVTVTDSQQRLVTDLLREDFEVYDNDKLQEIAVFENRPQPINVVVLLDTSYSMEMNLPLVRRATEQFFLRLFPGDKAKLGAFNDKVQLMPQFTESRDLLISELRHLDFGNATHLWDALAEGTEHLRGIDGRRVLLTFTDGQDVNSRASLDDVLDRARADEIMAYAIGLEADFVSGGTRVRSKPDGGLRKLAEETGGGYFQLEKTADLGATFTRVAVELHSQYLLGFAPATLDNKSHKLTVKVKKSGLTPRARKTYIAAQQLSEGR